MSTQRKPGGTTLTSLKKMKREGEKFACLTAYDACFATVASGAGVDVLLVGDSLGMVLQGHDSTLPVTMTDMIYHMTCVKRGNQGALLIADLPFMSYASEPQTLQNAAALMRAGAQIVKLEGGAWIANTTRLLAERGIPVCAPHGPDAPVGEPHWRLSRAGPRYQPGAVDHRRGAVAGTLRRQSAAA